MRYALTFPIRLILLVGVTFVFGSNAQTTILKYQGRLNDGGTPANGSFQMQFKLFDAVSGGAQIGSTLTDLPVTVVNGIFAVPLDFGSNPLSGSNRWLEIALRHNSGEGYVTLSPREQLTSSPYSVRTISASMADDSQKLGGVNANQFVQTNDVRLTNDRNPLPNSPNYIQNQTASPQASSGFNISGNGTATSLNVNGPFSFGGTGAPAVAPAGQGRLYFDTGTNRLRLSENGGAFINLVGSGGVNGTGTVNKIPLWSAGTSLGDSLISQAGLNIGLNTASPQSRFHTVGTSWFQGDSTPLPAAAGKGLAMGFTGEQGYLFGFDYGTFAPKNLILNGPGGSVGIGTTIPFGKLSVVSNSFGISHSDGTVNLSTYINGLGGWFGTVSDHPLHFYTGNSQPQVTLSQAGNLGIGNTNPPTKLFVEGNAGQSLGGIGLPKAMVYLSESGSILRCYNGITGSTTGGCGFSVGHPGAGQFNLNMGFDVQSNHFVTITPGVMGGFSAVINFLLSGNTIIYLVTNSATFAGVDVKAMVIVY